MTSLDTRIVELKFDNAQFEAGIRQTLASLDTLTKGLKMDGAVKGLVEVDAAAKRFSLANMATAVTDIRDKFSAMSVVAIAAIASITTRAISMGTNFAKQFTLDPLKQGLGEYETNLNAIQTILSNTAAAGTKLKDVNAALQELNEYSDQTIYNFSEMAKNIGTFTAAGVDLKTATGSIKGIANLAALSGSNSMQASTAMYQLSQAISSGRVSLQDWNSVVNAGMGGTVFQRALATTAERMGTLEKGSLKLKGSMKNVTIEGKSFRESITAKPGQESWLTSEVLTQTLNQFTGDMTDAQLAAEGFSKSQIKAIQDQAKMAKNAATQVKTFTQLMGTLKESAGSGWSQTWQVILGDFEEAKKMWTQVNNTLGGMIGASAEARNKMLGDWKKLGGRTAMIESVKNAFNGLMSVFKPIKEAFRDIFPPATGKQLADITKAIQAFTKGLTLSKETSALLKRTFAGVFAIFGIAVEVIKEVVGLFVDLSGGADDAATGFLGITAKVGDFLVKVLDTIRDGDKLHNFFERLGDILKVVGMVLLAPLKLIQHLGNVLTEAFSRVDPSTWVRIGNGFTWLGDAISNFFSKINMANFQALVEKLLSFENIEAVVSAAWRGLAAVFSKAKDIFGPAISAVLGAFSGFGAMLSDFFSDIDYDALLRTVNTGLFAGLVLIIKNFLKNFGKKEAPAAESGIKAFFDDITSPFKELTGTLQQMQATLKATTLLQIAIAVGILAASCVALSKIDADGLTRAVTAMGALFVQLTLAMVAFQKIDIKGGMTQLILVALALKILTSAVVDMAELDWNELAKGLTGTVVLLGALVTVANLMPDGKRMVSAGLGIILLAAGIRLLATSVEKIAAMSWGEIARGLTGVGALLGSLALFSKFASTNKLGIIQGAGIILLAVGINILADALAKLGLMSWADIASGTTAMAGGLAIMAAALKLVPPSSILSAAAIFIVAQSLSTIGDALAEMGKMSWADIASGLVAMAGSLAIIAGGLYLMNGTIAGAAALVIAAAALKILAPVLATLGKMSWADIASGLTLLAGALLIIAVGVTAMVLALPGAAALVVIAAALAALTPVLAALGSMSWGDIAKALVILTGALVILAVAVTAMVLALPGAGALVVISAALAVLAPVLVILGSMSWESIAKGMVVLAASFTVLGLAGLLLAPVIPTLLGLGAAIALLGVGVALAGVGLMAFGIALTAIAVSGGAASIALVAMATAMIGVLPQLGAAIGAAVISFAVIISKAGPAITRAMVVVVTSLLNAVIQLAPKITQTFQVLLNSLITLVMVNTPRIINVIFRMLTLLLASLIGFIPRLVNAGMLLITSILNGIAARIGGVITAATNVIVAFINGISANIGRVVDAGVKLIISLVDGLATAIRNNTAAMNTAGLNLASAIIDGMTGGLFSGIGRVAEAAKSVASTALSAAKSLLGIKSPSKEFYKLGVFSAQGYAKGLDGSRSQIVAAQKTMNDMLSSTRSAIVDDIKAHEAQLKRLNSAKRKDIAAIKATTAALKESRSELAKVNAAQSMAKTFTDEMKKLNTLGISAENVAKKLEDANKKLADATKTRDDYSKSVQEQYNKLGSIDKETELSSYVKTLQKQIIDTQIFTSQLQELRRRGLNDAMYKELLSKGADAIPFAKQILDGGQTAIGELNSLGSALSRSATTLGNSASKALYQAAVDSAAGLVKGLQNQQKNIEAQMDKIAGFMVAAIKKRLGIRSPSREFARIGDYTMAGLAKGLTNTRQVSKATDAVADDIVKRMRGGLTKLNKNPFEGMDLNPTVRPVLDLSDINKNASKISKILETKPLNVGVAYSQAQSTLSAIKERQETEVRPSNEFRPAVVFNQTNTSPKALSEAEIYRNTKNQLSRAKGALAGS